MTIPKTVLSYLLGWLIVQPVYNRLLRVWRRRQLESPTSETAAYFREQARHFVAELHRYTPGEPPAALDVILRQNAEIEQLRDARDRWRARAMYPTHARHSVEDE